MKCSTSEMYEIVYFGFQNFIENCLFELDSETIFKKSLGSNGCTLDVHTLRQSNNLVVLLSL